MIEAALCALDAKKGTHFAKRTVFAPIPDVFYDEALWCRMVTDAVKANTQAAKNICLIGHAKDASSYYLKEFPTWRYLECSNYHNISATPLREAYLLTGVIAEALLPPTSIAFLEQFKADPAFLWLQSETEYVKAYQHGWSSAPYPPIFVTTDSIVIAKNHILLIERKHAPGKGLLALPGGFLETNEWIIDGLLRELQEETKIEVPLAELKQALQSVQVFDYPKRAAIGRVITHAGLFKLNTQTLPRISGNDDAGAAFWVPLPEFWNLSAQLHDDHFQIVSLLKRQGALDA